MTSVRDMPNYSSCASAPMCNMRNYKRVITFNFNVYENVTDDSGLIKDNYNKQSQSSSKDFLMFPRIVVTSS